MTAEHSPRVLRDAHAAILRESAIEEAEARAAGIYSVSAEEASVLLAIAVRHGGFVIPYPGTDTLQVRLDADHVFADGRRGKYLCPLGRGQHLYLPPGTAERLQAELDRPLYVIEGAKKCLSGQLRLGITALGVNGCWGWRSKHPGPVVPELEAVRPHLRGRSVVLVFDSDARTNVDVARAAYALSAWLREEARARPSWAFPPCEGSEKLGLDDLIATKGVDAARELLAAPIEPVEPVSFVFRERVRRASGREAGTPFAGTVLFDELASVLALAAPTLRGALAEDARRILQLNVPERVALVGAASKGADGTAARPDAGDTAQGAAPRYEPTNPWPEPVDAAELLDEIAHCLRRFVVLPPHADEALALWTLHAHAFDAAEHSLVLHVTSPEKRCGKSRLLDVLEQLLPRALRTSGATVAAIFREVDRVRPTLLLDEIDSYLPGREDLRGLLNSCHQKSGARFLRTTGDDHETRSFSTWAPVVAAGIGELPETVADRALRIELRRRRRHEPVERLRARTLGAATLPLRRRSVRWATDQVESLRDADPHTPDALDDRAADGWRPLLAVADAAGGTWPARSRAAAVALAAGREGTENGSLGVQLLTDVRTAFGIDTRLATQELLTRLLTMDERPWPTACRGDKPLTPRRLAELLRAFGILSGSVRLGDGTTPKGYHRAAFEEAWERYLPPLSPRDEGSDPQRPSGTAEAAPRPSPAPAAATAPQASNRLPFGATLDPPQRPPVADARSPWNAAHSSRVAAWRLEPEDEEDFLEERAAIREIEAGAPRGDAERAARAELAAFKANGTAVRL